MHEIELYEGVSFNCKVDLKMKRPPILLHCKYEGIAHHMNLYGSFVIKEPSEKNKQFHAIGLPCIKVMPPKNQEKDNEFEHEWFYISMTGDQKMTVRVTFGGTILPETRGSRARSRQANTASR